MAESDQLAVDGESAWGAGRCQMVCVKPKPSFRSITDSWLLTRHTLLG